MSALARALVAVVVAWLVAGCEIVLFSWPAGEPVPDVRGAWQGLWLQSRLQLVIAEQDGTRVSGVVTYAEGAGGLSTGITGEFGIRNGRRVLLMTAERLDRSDLFELTTLDADRLEGMAAGRGLGGQRGPVTFRRP